MGDAKALAEALGWLLRSPPGADPACGSSGGGGAANASLPLAVWRLNRRRALQSKLPALLRAAAQRSPAAWRSVLEFMRGRWQRGAECGLLPALCSALEQLPPPPSEEERSQLTAFVRELGQGAAEVRCSAAARSRALGRAQPRDVQGLCAAVAQLAKN